MNAKQISCLRCALQVSQLIGKVAASAVANVGAAAGAHATEERTAYKVMQLRTIAPLMRECMRERAGTCAIATDGPWVHGR